jgi:hypothetical protein
MRRGLIGRRRAAGAFPWLHAPDLKLSPGRAGGVGRTDAPAARVTVNLPMTSGMNSSAATCTTATIAT